jgi:hypothetical protein
MPKTTFDLKTVQTEAQKRAQRAFHAGVGVTDLAVEAVRDYVATAQKQAQERVAGVQRSVTSFDAKARRAAIEKRVTELQAEALAVPSRVQKALDANVEAATETYGDLVQRGEVLVGRIRRQRATQDTVAAAGTTVAKAKTTRTQATKAAKKSTTAAKKSAAATRSSAKATRTSAKKTVSAGSRALADGAAKVGN